jgi:hypothetical protein
MPYLVALVGLAIVFVTLIDAFEVVLLPRPVRRRLRANHYFFAATWAVWARLAALVQAGRRREDFLGVFGPLSMVSIFATWALSLIVGFGMVHWALQTLVPDGIAPSMHSVLTVSGDAFFTLGYGDIVPHHVLARVLIILEAGTGFCFVALTIGYLPVLYQHFTQRDVQLIEFGARAGTPPTAATLLAWHGRQDDGQFDDWLREWEMWASDLVQSHSAYPMLAFYRTQHEGQSWLAALAVVLDTCALIILASDATQSRQAAATFVTARLVLDEISESLRTGIGAHMADKRLAPEAVGPLGRIAAQTLPDWIDDAATHAALLRMRQSYEPQLDGLANYLLLTVPDWIDPKAEQPSRPDNRDEVVARLLAGRAR